jgi:hypothetical protein
MAYVEASLRYSLTPAAPISTARSQWLPDLVQRDQSGFVLTGADLLDGERPLAT